MVIMKKRIVAIACACALALAMPALAFADPSPAVPDVQANLTATATTPSGNITVNVKPGTGTVESTSVSSVAANNVPAGSTVLTSFEVKGDATDVNLTFNVGTQYAGHTCTVYVQHNDGTTEALTATVSNEGTISIHVDKLSIFSIVMGDKTGGSVDGSAKSPQTGVDFGTVAGATAVAAIAAGVVFVALRKKVTE